MPRLALNREHLPIVMHGTCLPGARKKILQVGLFQYGPTNTTLTRDPAFAFQYNRYGYDPAEESLFFFQPRPNDLIRTGSAYCFWLERQLSDADYEEMLGTLDDSILVQHFQELKAAYDMVFHLPSDRIIAVADRPDTALQSLRLLMRELELQRQRDRRILHTPDHIDPEKHLEYLELLARNFIACLNITWVNTQFPKEQLPSFLVASFLEVDLIACTKL
jgi:hypothetical protein